MCNTLVYLIFCDKKDCNEKYVGETERSLLERLKEHKGYIVNKHMNRPTGKHFNRVGHNLSNMKITILEKMKNRDPLYRKERESYHIKKFNSFYKGMNQSP